MKSAHFHEIHQFLKVKDPWFHENHHFFEGKRPLVEVDQLPNLSHLSFL